MTMSEAIQTLKETRDLNDEALCALFHSREQDTLDALRNEADSVRRLVYGDEVYKRGLIEFTNHCKNNCYYCGIRQGNGALLRYRLSKEDILACCEEGYGLGFRTFVLQGGEDPYFTDEVLCSIVSAIHRAFPDCAVTLSVGERSKASYQALFDSGARRYLLRHETATEEHYRLLHPASMSLDNRKQCLFDLKDIGFQVGCGIMVGTPHQTVKHIYEDIVFMQKLEPHMIGIGPFIPHKDTPFRDEPEGSVEITLRLLAVLRLLFPKVLLPATTALGTADSLGREKGILAGANVMMPNLSPSDVRKKYLLYDGKICTGEEAAECNQCLRRRVERIGYHVADSRGDHPDFV